MTISRELLDELLKGCERTEDAALMKALKIKLMERMLGAEFTARTLAMKKARRPRHSNLTGAMALPLGCPHRVIQFEF